MSIFRLAPLILVAACTHVAPRPQPVPVDRLQAECTLLLAASTMIAAQGQMAPVGLREGCRGITATDTRPLSQQIASVRAANATPLPISIEAGTRAETVFRRMITRGVPPAIATTLASSAEFTIAAR